MSDYWNHINYVVYGKFHQVRELTAIELDFCCCFAVQPINLWIFPQNFYYFAYALVNARDWAMSILFISFTSLKSHLSSKKILFFI